MTTARRKNPTVIARAIIAISMMVLWTLTILSGLIVWLAPIGPRSGQIALFLGLAKHEWGDVHFWVSLIAIGVTLIHLIVDWKAFCGCVRYLASASKTGPSKEE